MNEYSILMYLLSRKVKEQEDSTFFLIGATEKEIKDTLGYKGQHASQHYQSLITSFSSAVKPFGLEVRQNPLNHYWFLVQERELLNLVKGNPFSNKPRLAATLCTILMLCLSENGRTSIDKIAEMREKKDIKQDLKELERGGFIEIAHNGVSLHENIGYYLALDDFLDILERI